MLISNDGFLILIIKVECATFLWKAAADCNAFYHFNIPIYIYMKCHTLQTLMIIFGWRISFECKQFLPILDSYLQLFFFLSLSLFSRVVFLELLKYIRCIIHLETQLYRPSKTDEDPFKAAPFGINVYCILILTQACKYGFFLCQLIIQFNLISVCILKLKISMNLCLPLLKRHSWGKALFKGYQTWSVVFGQQQR